MTRMPKLDAAILERTRAGDVWIPPDEFRDLAAKRRGAMRINLILRAAPTEGEPQQRRNAVVDEARLDLDAEHPAAASSPEAQVSSFIIDERRKRVQLAALARTHIDAISASVALPLAQCR